MQAWLLTCAPAAPDAQLLGHLADGELPCGLDCLSAMALLRGAEQPLGDCLTLLKRQAGGNNRAALLAYCSDSWQQDAASRQLWATQLFFLRLGGFSRRAFEALRSIAADQAGALGDGAAAAALQAAESLTLRVAHVGLLGKRGGAAVYLTRCAGRGRG